MSSDINIKSQLRNYSVNFIGSIIAPVEELIHNDSFFIIDKKILDIYSELFRPIVSSKRYIAINANEHTKTIATCVHLIEILIKEKVRRNHQLVAIGGGVIQDITAFSASITYRGIGWAFIPTTLLAQCDSCIGSKTSINFGENKNLIGNFYPPSAVFIDPSFFRFVDYWGYQIRHW